MQFKHWNCITECLDYKNSTLLWYLPGYLLSVCSSLSQDGVYRSPGLSPKNHGHHFLSLLCPSNVETQSWSPFLCLASTPSPYASLDLAGLTFFRPLLFSHLYTRALTWLFSKDCQGQSDPLQVFSLWASLGVFILCLGWTISVPHWGCTETYCHAVGGSQSGPGFFVAARAHSKVPGHFWLHIDSQVPRLCGHL